MGINLFQILSEIQKLKRDNHFKIIDSHVHPFDVMGVVHNTQHINYKYLGQFTHKFGPLEYLQYGFLANFFSKPACLCASSYINSMIQSSFTQIGEDRVLLEMDASLVDSCNLVPIEPWSLTTNIFNSFKSARFNLLGSLDIHGMSYDDIENTLSFYKKEYGIVGIKLHPNLQNFHPQPSCNEKEVEKKLRKIYEVLNKLRLYLLIHGGQSFFTNTIDNRYGLLKRSRKLGVLSNFIDADGRSEFFDNIKVPVIIAHLGQYGELRSNMSNVKKIVDNYSNVFFDTSGTSPKLIKYFIRDFGSDKVIFGSDAVYNSMAYNIIFAYLALKKIGGVNFIKNIKNVFENNITNIMDI